MSNINIETNLANINSDFLWESYGKHNDCAGFIYDLTNLFVNEHTGEMNVPYNKQVEFMNLLSPEDKVIVVLKCRQCVSGDSIVNVKSENPNINGFRRIEDAYNHWKETKEKLSIVTLDDNFKPYYDKVLDFWQAGVKDVYRYTFSDLQHLDCTKDHKINTLRGYVKAHDLMEDDSIIVSSNKGHKIVKLKHVKYKDQEMTYDLTTEKYHSYIANNIHVHNSGYSTACVALATFQAYFNLYKEVVILSASAAQSEKILDRVKKAYKSMPEEFRPKFVRENMTMIELQNGSKIYSLSSNPDTARGYTGVVYLDEYGVVPEKDSHELWKALYPTLTTGGRIVAVSTPKGKKGKFYDLASKSLSELTGKSVLHESKRILVSVDDVPHIKHARDYGGLFDGLNAEEIQQEYGLMFLDDNEDSFYGQDFVMQYLASKDYIIVNGEEKIAPLIRDYCEIFPDDLVEKYETDEKLEATDEVRIKNNDKIKYLLDMYSKFYAGWDIASVNDDSWFGIGGRRKDNPEIVDVILLMDMKKYSTTPLIQTDHVIRLLKIFNVSSGCGDATGLGGSPNDKIMMDDEIGDIWEGVVFNNTKVKLDAHNALKLSLQKGNLKMRWEENKWYKEVYRQMNNLYLMNGRLVGKGGKDDFPAFLSLLNKSFSEDAVESGLFFI